MCFSHFYLYTGKKFLEIIKFYSKKWIYKTFAALLKQTDIRTGILQFEDIFFVCCDMIIGVLTVYNNKVVAVLVTSAAIINNQKEKIGYNQYISVAVR